MTYAKQNEPTVQNLLLSNVVWILLETFSGTSQKADDVGSTDIGEDRKTKDKAKPTQAKKSEPTLLSSWKLALLQYSTKSNCSSLSPKQDTRTKLGGAFLTASLNIHCD